VNMQSIIAPLMTASGITDEQAPLTDVFKHIALYVYANAYTDTKEVQCIQLDLVKPKAGTNSLWFYDSQISYVDHSIKDHYVFDADVTERIENDFSNVCQEILKGTEFNKIRANISIDPKLAVFFEYRFDSDLDFLHSLKRGERGQQFWTFDHVDQLYSWEGLPKSHRH